MTRFDDLKQDNSSLEHEIAELQKKKADLLKEIEKASTDSSIDTFNRLKQLLHQQSDALNPRKLNIVKKNGGSKRQTVDDDYRIPEPVQHEFFDSSISQLMVHTTMKKHKREQESQNDGGKAADALLESIYRMFGITAFPLHNPSKSPTELLGIRIEIFNETELKFETPHYLILQQNSKTGKWDIFKHTIPIFIEVYKLAADYDGLSDYTLFDFLRTLRLKLQKTSTKHQIVERIGSTLVDNVKHIEKDLALRTLKFDLNIASSRIQVLLNLSLDNIESCHLESKDFTDSEKSRISAVLKGEINTFEKRLKDVIYSLNN